MANKAVITLGPFFTGQPSFKSTDSEVAPLTLAVEWASAGEAVRIPLFRRRSRHAPGRIALEHILFRHADLPCNMECQEYQVVDTPEGEFLPLDALLAALYQTREISRPVFSVLSELAALIPFHHQMTKPMAERGLLVPAAEEKGFRLNAVFQESGTVYAQVGWEPACGSTRFHACVARFQPTSTSSSKANAWVPPGEAGVSKLLAIELRRTVPGNPADLFTPAGIKCLEAAASEPSLAKG